MAADIIDGKEVAARIRAQLKDRVARLRAAGKVVGLDVISVGPDPASAAYIRNKRRAADEVGVRCAVHSLPQSSSQEDVLALIDMLNRNPETDGIIVQMPLPEHIAPHACVGAIRPDKDVDGFHTNNQGLLLAGKARLMPCTPLGILRLLDDFHIPVTGQHAVIVGVGNVGRPLAVMLMERRATVTVCHSRTGDLGVMTRQADILIAAAGRPRLITADMVKPGATVIDVGIHQLPDGGLCGDVDFGPVSQIARRISPVPGGVGPTTVAMLLANTISAAEGASASLSADGHMSATANLIR